MRADLIDKIRQSLSREFVMRSLVRYFKERNFENFDAHIYPPTLQDIPKHIPALADKVEIEPYVESVDQKLGSVHLGWNLFVLGTYRMYLGSTIHRSLTELHQTSAPAGTINELRATPRNVTKFIISVLTDNGEKVQPSASVIPTVPSMRPRIGPTWSGGYYEKRRPLS